MELLKCLKDIEKQVMARFQVGGVAAGMQCVFSVMQWTQAKSFNVLTAQNNLGNLGRFSLSLFGQNKH